MEHESSPQRAMVLAAGLGTRMRPITDTMPKPLVRVGGKALLDWGLDGLVEAGVETSVVNVHHLPDQIIDHLSARAEPQTLVSDERDQLLDSAGGIVKALPLLGPAPFFILNADTFWIDSHGSSASKLADHWNSSRMDMLLLLVDPAAATGHSSGGDFLMQPDGRLRRGRGLPGALIYTGFGIVHPRIFAGASPTPHSLNLYFDRAIEQGRLYGLPLDGHWITVGTPGAIEEAERALAITAGAR